MSERWYAKSAFFRSEAASYRDSVLQSDRLHGKLQTLQFLNHTPILCWLEKGFMVFDFLQLFALMWIMAQPWPWPYLWSAYTRPVVYVNADVFSTTVHGALAGSSTSEYSDWGSMDNYLPYALLFAAIQCLAFWSIILLRQGRDVYGIITPDNKHSIIAFLTVFSYVAYLPCSLATFRLYYCEDRGGSVLAADPTVQCAGPTHITFLLICSFCTLPVFFGFPYMIFKYIQRTVVYGDSCDHEKRLQIWEILHMLGLDDYWVKRQFWISSSFTKFGVFYRFNMLLLKAFYLLIFVFLRFNLLLQSVVCTLATCAFSSYYGLGFVVSWTNMPFRNKLSNMISLCCYSMLITASTFGMVNSFGVENAITVGSTQSLVMFAFHTCFVVCILLLLAATLVRSLRLPDWPSAHTMNHIWHNKELLPKAAKWVESIRDAMIIRADFLMAPVEVADINSLEEVIRVLRGNWLSARSVGSLFEVPIGELLEELLYIHAKRYPAALRKVPCWDAAYADEEVRGVLALRHGDRAMMAPAKKRVMMKLLAIRFMRGDRGEFSMDVALKQARADNLQREETERERKAIQSKKHRRSSIKGGHGGFGFSKFATHAKTLLAGLVREGSAKGGEMKSDGPEGELEGLLKMEQGEAQEEKETGGEGGEYDFEEEEGFSEEEVAIAAEMIARLIERTEAALHKHHHARQTMVAQENQALATAIEQNQHSVTGMDGGLSKITTMDLIKETVDAEEQNELEEMYLLWDEAIQLYEMEEFPGDYELLNNEAENWYTYRGLITQRLEVVVRTLQERDYEALFVGQEEVIEEGEESDDEGEGGARPPLQLQTLSSRGVASM